MMTLTIENIGEVPLPSALTFMQSWNSDDVYDRFGTLGRSGSQWLAAELERRTRDAFVVRQGKQVVALLDYVEADGAIHFGIVVERAHRRRRYGTALVRALIERNVLPIVAECRFDNAAAVALLRSTGFIRSATAHGESLWRR